MDALLSLSVFSPLFASGNIFPLFKVYELLLLLPSCVWPFVTPWTAARQASLSSPSPGGCPSSCSLNQWCCPAISSSDALFSFYPQSFPALGTFPLSFLCTSDWSFSFSISSSIEYSGLISLKIDWFNLAVQGTFRSPLKGVLLSGVGRHQFFGNLPSLPSSSQNCTWLLGRP